MGMSYSVIDGLVLFFVGRLIQSEFACVDNFLFTIFRPFAASWQLPPGAVRAPLRTPSLRH